MIGYVRAYKPEMKFKDYEYYKGVYCSLCKQLGKRYGLLARMILSYDFTFFAVVRMAVRDGCPDVTASRCTFNPAKKCLSFEKNNEDLEYTADISILTMYYKLLDNIADSGFFKSLLCKILLPYAKSKFKKARAYQPEMAKMMAEQMARQTEIEKRTCSIDEAADPSARMLGELLKYNIECSDFDKMYRFGYLIGRWVYLIDAVDDVRDDIKKGGFNPLKEKYSQDNFKEYAKEMLTHTVNEAVISYNMLKFYKFDDIISNVLIYGTRSVMKKVLNEEDNK